MPEKTYQITLADGTVLENLTLNGNNYISKVPVDFEIFQGQCHRIEISDGENVDILENVECVPTLKIGDEQWFIFRQISDKEIAAAKVRSDIEYLALMCDVEL